MNDFEVLLSALALKNVSFVIVGGVAATVHGSARLTSDLDVVYERSPANLQRLAEALLPLRPYLRGAPPALPFQFDADTLRRGLNFTLTTTAGSLDLLGELTGVGDYAEVYKVSDDVPLFGSTHRCINLDGLITSKRAAGSVRDFEAVAELEIIRDERARGE